MKHDVEEDGPGPVLVTGATRGVGLCTTERLLGEGRAVIGVYRSANKEAEEQREAAARAGRSLRLLRADLGVEAGIQSVVDAVDLPLAGIVFNAGVAHTAPFSSVDLAEQGGGSGGGDPLRIQLRLDLEAPLLLLRALIGADRVRRGGALVFVSSNLARHGLAGKVAYGAAKAGLEGATRGLAREFGPRKIRVNAVAPGLLRTEMTRAVGDAGFAAYAKEVPLGRVGRPEDVAGTIAFLLGPDAAYISGQILDVDGGWGC